MSPRRSLPYRSGPGVLKNPSRSSLDLLGVPYAFTQAPLLTVPELVRAAEVRGTHLDSAQLELLHRRGLFVPLLRIHVHTVGEPTPTVGDTSIWSSDARLIQSAAATGRLSDPARRRFRPWPTGPYAAGVRYSHYQLLALRSLSWTMRAMRAKWIEGRVHYELDPAATQLRESFAQHRALAIVLEALSPRYRPVVMRVLRGATDELSAHLQSTVSLERTLISHTAAELLNQAEHLIRTANGFDPLGKWHRVTRISRPERWDDLRFDALLAQEHRIAAEMLLLFHEDLERMGHARPLPPVSNRFHEARHDRLEATARERGDTILDFGLIDRPGVVLAVEGETEMIVARRLLQLFGFDEGQGLIQLVDLEGVGGDVQLLARAVCVPRLDPDGYRGARVMSSLTALVVAVDPEGAYRTHDGCNRRRNAMVETVLRALTPELRTKAMRTDVRELLHVRAWPHTSFEFAHFSDAELASGIRKVVGRRAPKSAALRNALAKARAGGGTVDNAFKGFKLDWSKPRLAESLLPTLERRLMSVHSRRPVPIAEVVDDAIRLGFHVRQVRELRVAETDTQ